jgi:hypothetical protein
MSKIDKPFEYCPKIPVCEEIALLQIELERLREYEHDLKLIMEAREISRQGALNTLSYVTRKYQKRSKQKKSVA